MFEVSEQLEREIKSKRIKKELYLFKQSEIEDVTFQALVFNSLGISIPFTYNKGKTYKFELRLDKQYPFNRPQIHSLDGIEYYGQGRDLLGEYLERINVLWGPSKMLRDLVVMIPEIVNMIQENIGKAIGKYYNGQLYLVEQLKTKGMKMFKVVEITSRLWGKKRQNKTLFLSLNYILHLNAEDSNKNPVILFNHHKISQIKDVSADLKTLQLKLSIQDPSNKNITTIIYGLSTKQQLTSILSIFNPFEMMQKQIIELQKSKVKSQQLLKLYTTIVQYYSIRNKAKYDQYMQKMKNTIQQIYK